MPDFVRIGDKEINFAAITYVQYDPADAIEKEDMEVGIKFIGAGQLGFDLILTGVDAIEFVQVMEKHRKQSERAKLGIIG